jgi:hypothetical protein
MRRGNKSIDGGTARQRRTNTIGIIIDHRDATTRERMTTGTGRSDEDVLEMRRMITKAGGGIATVIVTRTNRAA